ncbi:IS110 family transposase, partial [Aestuariibius sp. 2305UL40-4]
MAKDVFQVHGISENGRVIFNKAIKRAKLLAFFETLPPCIIGMEACGSSHHWGRQLRKLGHDVKLMPAGYVKPYVKRGKNDCPSPLELGHYICRERGLGMARKRHSDEDVLKLLREIELKLTA